MTFSTFLVVFFQLSSIISFGQNIEFINKEGTNEWWHALYMNNYPSDSGAIVNVELLDSSENAEWMAAYSAQGALGTFYAWQNNNGFTLPYSVRVTNCNNNDQITFEDAIDSRVDFEVFETNNGNFGPSTCDGSVGNSNNLILQNKDGINGWWHSVFINNRNENAGDITKVELLDSSDNAAWVTGYSGQGDYGTFYAFQAGTYEWQLPLSIRITNCAGDVITADNVITNRLTGTQFDFGMNFQDSTCETPTPVASSNDNIKITKFQGYNVWWAAIEIDNVSDGNVISSVELRDSGNNDSSNNIWIPGNYHDWGSVKVWTFEAGYQARQFELNFDIRITNSNGVTIQGNDIITQWDDGMMYDFGTNF